MASTYGLNKRSELIPRIELSVIETFHPLICLFYYLLIIFLTVSFYLKNLLFCDRQCTPGLLSGILLFFYRVFHS